ncbi:MAG: Tol-Pal system beta propeller repeat protein TolB [Pontibacterium sp.]
MRHYKSFIFVLGLMLVSLTARAELSIEITQGVAKPTPVAVVPFSWSGDYGLADDVAEVIASDFGRSGLFSVMDRANMLSTPSRQREVAFRDWRIAGQEYLVIGRILPVQGDAVKVEYEVYDVVKDERILVDARVGSRHALRDVAHVIADNIYEYLTGLKGAFYTRLLYVTAEKTGVQQYRYRLRLADSDGARPRTILESKEPIMSPSWSQDVSRVAYVSFESGRPAIYIQDLKTGQRQKIQSFPGLNGAPAWSPDGRSMALVLSKDGNPEIYLLDLQHYKLTRLTHHYGIDTEPSWSPDGRSLLFTSDRGGQPQIYQMDLKSRTIDRLTYEGNYNARASLTQDGRFLAMVHRGHDQVFRIAVQDLKTGRVDILTETYLDESPTIAPNGSMVLYATQRGNQGVLAGATLDGNVRFLLPPTQGDVREPAWSPYLQ